MSNGRSFTNAGRLVFAGFTLLHTGSAESKIAKTRCSEGMSLLPSSQKMWPSLIGYPCTESESHG